MQDTAISTIISTIINTMNVIVYRCPGSHPPHPEASPLTQLGLDPMRVIPATALIFLADRLILSGATFESVYRFLFPQVRPCPSSLPAPDSH